MSNKILLIGGGGHCHSVIDSIISLEKYDQIGVVARDRINYEVLRDDKLICDYLVGTDNDLTTLYENGWVEAFVAIGSIGNPIVRRRVNEQLIKMGLSFPLIVDKSAVVSNMSEVEPGTFIGKSAIVNSGCYIGECSIINTGSVVEHDCSIGSFCHISPGAIVCGNVSIGENSHIGAGSVIRQGITIGKDVLVGVGSVVVNDIPDGVKAYGNPCKVVE